jgi:hypothetical protein
MSLPPCVLNDLDRRIAPPQLVNAGNDDLEPNPQLFENLPPLERARCEDDVQSSGNQMPISRSADSSESDPWTMLKVTSSA